MTRSRPQKASRSALGLILAQIRLRAGVDAFGLLQGLWKALIRPLYIIVHRIRGSNGVLGTAKRSSFDGLLKVGFPISSTPDPAQTSYAMFSRRD